MVSVTTIEEHADWWSIPPFKGLDYFRESDADAFGGRDEEVRSVIARISSRRMLVLYGESGVGKTSLLLAGVFPELTKRRRWRAVHFNTLRKPARELVHGITDALGGRPSSDTEEMLKLLRRFSQDSPIVLAFDQFESLFRRPFRDRRAFIRRVGEIINDQNIDCRLIFSLREEHIHHLDELSSVFAEPLSNRYRLHGLSVTGARHAIRRMLSGTRYDADSGFMSRLLSEVTTRFVDPILLQIYCHEAWSMAVSADSSSPPEGLNDVDRLVLTAHHLEKAGTADEIFERQFDKALQQLDREQRFLVRLVIDAMVTEAHTKEPRSLIDFATSPEWRFTDLRAVSDRLEVLKEAHLVRAERRGGEDLYELAHDRLVQFLRGALRRNKDFLMLFALREHIRTMAPLEAWRKSPQMLLGEGMMAEEAIRKRHAFLQLDDIELEFVLWSAIQAGGSEYGTWAVRIGEDIAKDTVIQQMSASTDTMRAGAARSAANVANFDSGLLQRCLEMALGDREEKVRDAAADTLIQRASSAQLDAISEALNAGGDRRRRAEDVLLKIALAGRPLASFGRYWRIRARRRANAEILAKWKDFVRTEANKGIIVGVGASLLWVVGILFPTAIALSTIFVQYGPVSAAAKLTLVGFFPAATIGGTLGWLVTRRQTKMALLNRRQMRIVSLLTNPIYWLVLLVPLAGLVASLILREGWSSIPAISSAAFVAAWFVVAIGAQLAEMAMPAAKGLRSSIFWIWLVSLVLPATFLAVLVPGVLSLEMGLFHNMSAISFVFAAAIASFTILVGGVCHLVGRARFANFGAAVPLRS